MKNNKSKETSKEPLESKLILLFKTIYKISVTVLPIAISILAYNISMLSESHSSYMERLNYSYTYVEGNNYYNDGGINTNIKAPQIQINIKTGSISNITFIAGKKEEINYAESINNIDIENAVKLYKDFKNNYILLTELGDIRGCSIIRSGNKVIVPYYILIEGMNGDKYFDLIVEEVDMVDENVEVYFYNYVNTLSKGRKEAYMEEILEDYEGIYELLKSKELL